MKKLKLCTKCKHIRNANSAIEVCHKKAEIATSVVDGSTYLINVKPCFIERGDIFLTSYLLGSCGRQGRFFEQADK